MARNKNKDKSQERTVEDARYASTTYVNPKGKNIRERVTMSSKPDMTVIKGRSCNDPAWYQKNSELYKAAGSLGFTSVIGAKVDHNQGAIPGILAFYWVPSIGNQTIANTAFHDIYDYVVHANSRNKNYTAADVGCACLAADSAFSAIAMGIRAYSFMRTYQQQNLYMPRPIIESMGFDYADLNSHLPNMWYDLNALIAEASPIWVPKDLTYITRHYWMNSNVYADGMTSRAQLYLYVQRQYWKLDVTTEETGTSLQPIDWMPDVVRSGITPSNLKTWSQYTTFVRSLIEPLRTFGDSGMMYGDILNAYGAERIYGIPEVSAETRAVPVFSEEVLAQLHNTIAVDIPLETVVQDQTVADVQLNFAEIPKAQFETDWRLYSYPTNPVFDFFKREQPSIDDVVVGSRNMQMWAGYGSTTTGYTPIMSSTGSDRVQGYGLYWNDYSTGLSPTVSKMFYASVFSNSSTVADVIRVVTRMSKFDWAPLLYFVTKADTAGGTGGFFNQYRTFGDLENFIEVSSNEIRKLNEMCLYSEFGVPTT